mgnify:FL=1
MNIDEFALKGETFKPLAAPFEKYLVSDYGRIWNSKTKKPVALSKCYFSNHRSRGYLACMLYSGGAQKHVFVHRLVASVFCENPDPETHTIVDHIDNDPRNNLASNLRWVTPRINTTEAFSNELQKYTRWLIQKTQEETNETKDINC